MKPLTCEQAVKQFFAYLDRALSGESLEDMEGHLQECMSCCDKLAFNQQLDAFFNRHLPDSPVPAGLEARVRRALSQAAGG